MKYELMSNNDYHDVESTLCEVYGVDSMRELTDSSVLSYHAPSLLKNMKKAVELMADLMGEMKRFHIIVDSDVDGLSSASMLYLWMQKVYNSNFVTWSVHTTTKAHGILLEELDLQSFDVLLVPDAGSGDFEAHKKLKEAGKTVIVFDHHECGRYSEDALVVNPQLDTYPNKHLSGSGVVFKFIQAMEAEYGFNYQNEFVDLAMLGIVSDIMDTVNEENRKIILEGLSYRNNGFLQRLLLHFRNKADIGIPVISFYIAPLLNAVFRVGSVADIEHMFRCFIHPNKKIYNKNKPDSKPQTYAKQHLQDFVNLKEKQKEDVLNVMSEAKVLHSGRLNIYIINEQYRSLTGLLANKYASDLHKPTLVLVDRGDKYTGSGRNFESSPVKSFKKVCIDAGVLFAKGHGSAFGVKIEYDEIKDNVPMLEKKLSEFPEGEFYPAMFVLNGQQVTSTMVSKIHEYRNYYGKGASEPKVVITDVVVKSSDVYTNDKKTVVKFPFNTQKMSAIDFKKVEELELLLKDGETHKLNLIGKLSENVFRGKTYYQIILDSYEELCYNKGDEPLYW